MSFETTSAAWEYLAQHDPLWAIHTRDDRRGNRWEVEEFLQTGEDEIARQFAYLGKIGAEPVDRELAVDFGCGVGRLSRALSMRFRKVIGVDVSPTMVSLGRELQKDRENLEFLLNQRNDLSVIADGSVSFVFTYIVLQHIPSGPALRYIEEFFRIVKRGGMVMFHVPTRDRSPRWKRMARAIVPRVAQRLRLPVKSLYIEMFTVPRERIEAAAQRAGCELVAVYDAFRLAPQADGSLAPTATAEGAQLESGMFVYRKRG